jgi:peroxiredoxin Q/BCP
VIDSPEATKETRLPARKAGVREAARKSASPGPAAARTPARKAAAEAAAPKAASRGAVEEGKAAPAFHLSDADGRKVSLADLRGKHVVLYFYPKDDTPGCTKEACGFRDLWRDVQKLGAVVIGVSADDGASHQRFAKKYALPFTLLSDPDRSVMTKYGAWGEKTMYGRKTLGVIRSTVWIGPDGRVRRHWARVARAEDHPARVLEALRAG